MMKDPDWWPHQKSFCSFPVSAEGLDEPLLVHQAPSRPTDKASTPAVAAAAAAVYIYTWWDHVCLCLVLPMLMCLQFAMALRYAAASSTTIDTSPDVLSFRSVIAMVGLFIVISYVYKQTCLCLPLARTTKQSAQSATATCAPLILLFPEMLVDLVLGTVWLGSVELGWKVLVACTLGLGAAVIVMLLLRFYYSNYYCIGVVDDEKEMKCRDGDDTEANIQAADHV